FPVEGSPIQLPHLDKAHRPLDFDVMEEIWIARIDYAAFADRIHTPETARRIAAIEAPLFDPGSIVHLLLDEYVTSTATLRSSREAFQHST
ncbi:MAG: hypothetical protein ABI743_15280, partial [bacterium]